jgi:hypothetical protein
MAGPARKGPYPPPAARLLRSYNFSSDQALPRITGSVEGGASEPYVLLSPLPTGTYVLRRSGPAGPKDEMFRIVEYP